MRNKHTLPLILLFSFYFSTISFGQFLFEDAKAIYAALESGNPTLVVKSDGITKLRLDDEPYIMLFPPLDSIQLSKKGVYAIDLKATPSLMELVLDSIRYNNFLFDKILISDKIQVENNSDVLFTINDHTRLNVLGVLKTYTFTEDLDTNSVINNPFLSKIISKQYFKNLDQTTMDQIDAVALKKQIVIQNGLALLYADSLLNDELTVSINQVQEKYQNQSENSFETAVKSLQTKTKSDFNTAALLEGLSDFIVDRAQEEFNITFMENLKSKLLDTLHYPEISILFKETSKFLNKIQISNYKSFIPQMREVMIRDAQNFFFNFPEILKLEKYVGKKEMLQPIVYDLITMYSMAELLQRDISIDTILPYTYNKIIHTTKNVDKDIYQTIAIGLLQDTRSNNLIEFQKLISEHVSSLITIKNNVRDRALDIDNHPLQDDYDFLNGPVMTSFSSQSTTFGEALFDEETYLGWKVLNTIPANLKGKLYYENYKYNPNIDDFASIFMTDLDSIQLLGAGLELAKVLACGNQNQSSKAQLLYDMHKNVSETEYLMAKYLTDKDNALLATKIKKFESYKNTVIILIDSHKKSWTNEHDIAALDFISTTINNLEIDSFTYTENWSNINDEFSSIKIQLVSYLEQIEPNKNSDLYNFLTEETVPTYTYIPDPEIESLLKNAKLIKQKIGEFESLYAEDLIKAKKNLHVLGNLIETNAQLLNLFKANPSSGQKWISIEQRKELLNNPKLQKIYLGLVYQQLQSIKKNSTLSPAGIANLTTHFMHEIGNIQTATLNLKVKNYSKRDSLETSFRDYYPILRSVLSLMEKSINTPLVIDQNNPKSLVGLFGNEKSIALFPSVAKKTLDLFDNTHEKHYNYALYNIVELLNIVSPPIHETSLIKRRKEYCKDHVLNNYHCKKKFKKEQEALKVLQKYGNFMGQVAVATHANQVNAALKAVALPAGSSRLKRQTPFSISINGYFGFNLGHEKYNKESLRLEEPKLLNTYGLSVPIGVSTNFKFSQKHKSSFTVFLPIIDIGMITAYRIDDKNAALPETTFKNVLAPGAFLLYNFRNSPFSVGFGAQFGPQNRKVAGEDTGAIRYTLMGGIDVPFFNLFQRSY